MRVRARVLGLRLGVLDPSLTGAVHGLSIVVVASHAALAALEAAKRRAEGTLLQWWAQPDTAAA
jgi:hypothetical protein